MDRRTRSDESDDAPPGKVRLDKWLWAARFFKTRTLAAEAIDGGKVEVNGERAKRARLVQADDRIRLRDGAYEWLLVVKDIAQRRGSATIAQQLYEETARQSGETRGGARATPVDAYGVLLRRGPSWQARSSRLASAQGRRLNFLTTKGAKGTKDSVRT
jgi:ribosomal 50S subunit-recycling heat shock protein